MLCNVMLLHINNKLGHLSDVTIVTALSTLCLDSQYQPAITPTIRTMSPWASLFVNFSQVGNTAMSSALAVKTLHHNWFSINSLQLTKKIVSKIDKHLRILAKLGLSSTSFLLKVQTQRTFPKMEQINSTIFILYL